MESFTQYDTLKYKHTDKKIMGIIKGTEYRQDYYTAAELY